MKSSRLALAIAFASMCVALPQSAAAQGQYKSTMPDGRVLYGDTPAPGAAKVEEIQPSTAKGGLGGTTAREKATLKDIEKERLQREGTQEKVRAAEQRLRDAEAARAAGKEPLEGERTGTAGGSSRLNDSYFERQRMLEENVGKARRELDEARAGK